jgi:hypothetical protein
MLEPIYLLTALFARGAKADISARGTKRVKTPCLVSTPELSDRSVKFNLVGTASCDTVGLLAVFICNEP